MVWNYIYLQIIFEGVYTIYIVLTSWDRTYMRLYGIRVQIDTGLFWPLTVCARINSVVSCVNKCLKIGNLLMILISGL
jgi:hypothetical protein